MFRLKRLFLLSLLEYRINLLLEVFLEENLRLLMLPMLLMVLMLPMLPKLLRESLRIAGTGLLCGDVSSLELHESTLQKSWWYNIFRSRSLLFCLLVVFSRADHLALLRTQLVFIATYLVACFWWRYERQLYNEIRKARYPMIETMIEEAFVVSCK